jgi:hypothetical protein
MAGAWIGALVNLGGGVWASPLSAQDRGGLTSTCSAGGTSATVAGCAEAVHLLEALRGGVSLSLSQGSDIPGFSSTVGLGDGGRPRISTSVRFGITRVNSPVFRKLQQGPAASGRVALTSVQGTVGLGVFNGFAGPGTLRGLLSLDLLGSAGVAILPKSEGFQANVVGLGYGARVGLLREGFANPGVSVSIMRREFGDDVFYGGPAENAQIRFDPGSTSVRLTVGRDYFPAGFVLGAGLDWYGGAVSVTVRNREFGGQLGDRTVSSTSFTSRRATVFGGGQYTYLIFQTSLEVGWADGFGGIDGYSGPFNPGSGTYYGSLALRVTF